MAEPSPLICRRRGLEIKTSTGLPPPPPGEAEIAAVAADKGASNLSTVISGWFSENSPMWPGTARES